MSKPERVGPIAGLLALALLVVNLVATRESPTPDTPTGKMVAELLDHRNAYVASAALIFAQAILLLVFVVAIAALCFSGPARLRTSWRGSRSCPQRRGGGRCTTGSPPCSAGRNSRPSWRKGAHSTYSSRWYGLRRFSTSCVDRSEPSCVDRSESRAPAHSAHVNGCPQPGGGGSQVSPQASTHSSRRSQSRTALWCRPSSSSSLHTDGLRRCSRLSTATATRCHDPDRVRGVGALVAPFHCACARVRARIKSGGRLTPGNKAPCFDIRRRGWVVSGRAIR